MTPEQSELIKFIVSVISPVVAGCVGVWYGLAQIKLAKRLEFVEKQLRDFYSPLLGIRKDIEAVSGLRPKIQAKSEEVWQEDWKTGNQNIGGQRRVMKRNWDNPITVNIEDGIKEAIEYAKKIYK